jgi:hypothetical protein
VKTFRLFFQGPYSTPVELIPPRVLSTLAEAPPFPCAGGIHVRHPGETKGVDDRVTTDVAAGAGGPNGSCC